MPNSVSVPGRKFGFGTGQHGKILCVGDSTPDNTWVGGYAFDIRPSLDFAGSIAPVCRLGTREAGADDLTFVAWPFRAFYLNGMPADGSMQPVGTAITGASSIVVPAPGQTVGLLIACTAGTCTVYNTSLTGPTIP